MTTLKYHDIMVIFLLAAALLASCSSEDGAGNSEEKQGEELRLDIQGEGLKRTRGATIVTNDAGLQADDVAITAYFHDSNRFLLGDVTLRYVTDHWEFVDGSGNTLHYYWPIEGSVYKPSPYLGVDYSSLDFIGFWPKTGSIYTNYIATSCTAYTHHLELLVGAAGSKSAFPVTPAGQDGLKEFMFAFLPNQTYDDQVAAGGALPLQFKHPFALVKFVITPASGTHVQINSISLAGLKTSGACNYNGTDITWGAQSGSADMTLTEVLKNGGTTETTPLMVIPNNYGSKTLTVNATWDDWSNVTMDVEASVDLNWEPGYIYTYNLTLDKYALKVDTDKFTEQW